MNTLCANSCHSLLTLPSAAHWGRQEWSWQVLLTSTSSTQHDTVNHGLPHSQTLCHRAGKIHLSDQSDWSFLVAGGCPDNASDNAPPPCVYNTNTDIHVHRAQWVSLWQRRSSLALPVEGGEVIVPRRECLPRVVWNTTMENVIHNVLKTVRC